MLMSHRSLRCFVRSVLALLVVIACPAFGQFTNTTTSLAVSSGGSAAYGTVVTLTATVTSDGSPVSPGQVKFCDVTGGAPCKFLRLLATSQLTAAGIATYRFTPRSGTHVYQAVFPGRVSNGQPAPDGFLYEDFSASSSATSTLVVTGNSTTSILKSGTQGNYTLTSKVTGEGLPFPTGTLSFKDTSNGNAIVGSASLIAGTSAQYPKSTSTTGTNPGSMATGDFNGDGLLDLAVANRTGNSITILQGNGDGTFTALANPTAITSPDTVATGDFDNDGFLDLVVSTSNGTVVSLKGDGHGSFTTVSTLGGLGSPFLFVLHDVDDGNLDLPGFIPGTDGAQGANGTGLVGYGNGQFGPSPAAEEVECPYAQEAFAPTALTLVNDGSKPGVLASVGIGYESVHYTQVGFIRFSTLPYGGDCGEYPHGTQQTGTNPVAVASGDFNGDGIADFVVVNQGDNNLSIFLGQANGSLVTMASPATGPTPTSVVVGDFDGDGITDLAVSNSGDGTILIFKGAGDGTFTTLTTLGAGSAPSFLVSGDFNGNGQFDLAVSNPTGNTATVYLTTPEATATATVTGINPRYGLHFVDAVFPSDTHYFASFSPTVDLSRLNTTTTVSSVNPNSIVNGGNTTLTASVVNTEDPATYPIGTVAFSTTVGGTTYAACTTAVTSGVASCTYTATHSGANTITAAFTPTNPANFSASADATGKPLTVTVATVTLGSLTVTGFPSPDRNGTAHTVTVTAYDTNGTLLTGYTGSVTLTSNDALATLPAAYTFVSGDNGAHTFTVTLATGGTRTITVTDSLTSIHASQSNIVVDDFIWIVGNTGVTMKFDETGTNVATGGIAGSAASKGGIAVDASGSVWSVSSANNTLNFATRAATGASSYTGGGLNAPASVAIDGAGLVWVANSGGGTVSAFSSAGAAQSPSAGYGSASLGSSPSAVAIDNSGGVWVTSKAGNSVTHIIGSATPVVTPQSTAVTNATVGVKP